VGHELARIRGFRRTGQVELRLIVNDMAALEHRLELPRGFGAEFA
jgi:hypothetical protein